MQNPIIVQDVAILVDPKRLEAELVSFDQGPGSFTVDEVVVGIYGLPPSGTPFQVTLKPELRVSPGSYLSLSNLDEPIKAFHSKNPAVKFFMLTVRVTRRQTDVKNQTAEFLGKFVEEGEVEIDRFPIKSDSR